MLKELRAKTAIKPMLMMTACILCAVLVLTACTDSRPNKSAVTEAEVKEMIIGRWIVADIDGQPAMTNDKCVFTFTSADKALISASFNARPELGRQWIDQLEADVAVSGNKVTITRSANAKTTIVDELSVTGITADETIGDLVVKLMENGSETIVSEGTIRLARVNIDCSEDILGMWEGRCTSEGSVFDDGETHRWEYKADGNYSYYVKNGDSWEVKNDLINDYFVTGNLLCTRWGDNDHDDREWWEISINGESMNWTALRSSEDGSTYTVTFEMTKVTE